MSTPQNIASARLVLKNILDTYCIESIEQLIEKLPDLLGVEIPASSLTNVVVSNIQPSDSQTTDVWFRLSNSGSFLGIYVFADGVWNVIYPVNYADQVQIFWHYSPTGEVPPGFEKITAETANINADIVTALMAQYLTADSIEMYFAMQYIGF